MYIFYALLSAVFASLVTIFGKLGLEKLDSTLSTGIRSVIMAIFMVGVVVITNKLNVNDIKNIETRDWIVITLSGIAGAVSWIFYFLALKNAQDNTSRVAAIDKLSLAFIFIFSLIFLREKFDAKVFIGILLMVIGAVITTL